MQQLKSRLKSTTDWNKYHLKTTIQNATNQYLDYLIDSSFQGVNRLYRIYDNRIGNSTYYLPNAKVEDYKVKIDEKNVFNQQIKNDVINIWKHSTDYKEMIMQLVVC